MNFSSSSVCKIFSLSLTGNLSHVPSVVLSMLETKHSAELETKVVHSGSATVALHAAPVSGSAAVYTPGGNRSSPNCMVPSDCTQDK